MSGADDTDGVIQRPLSEDDADRLLAGRPVALGAEASGVAALLAALRSDGSPDELDDTDEFVAHLAGVVRSSTPGVISLADRPSRRRTAGRVTGKVAVLAAATLLSAGAAAAATGTLPDPIQRGVSSTFSHIGLDLPSPADNDDRPDDETPAGDEGGTTGDDGRPSGSTDSNPTPTTPDGTTIVTTPQVGGLCTAYRAGGRLGGAAGATLEDAARQAGISVDELCPPHAGDDRPGAGTPGSTETGKPESTPGDTAPGRSDDTSAPTAPGVTAPGNGGTSPSDTAPGQTGANGGNSGNGGNGQDNGKSGAPPGQTAPGTDATTPGDTAPGKGGTPPGETAPGRTQPTAKGRPTTTTTTTTTTTG